MLWVWIAIGTVIYLALGVLLAGYVRPRNLDFDDYVVLGIIIFAGPILAPFALLLGGLGRLVVWLFPKAKKPSNTGKDITR